MPHFATNPLKTLGRQAAEAEAELDLRGLSVADALASVDRLISDPSADKPRSYRLCFDPASGDGTETLFQPLGRHLLQARRAGQLQSCLPLPDGNGYYIELAG